MRSSAWRHCAPAPLRRTNVRGSHNSARSCPRCHRGLYAGRDGHTFLTTFAVTLNNHLISTMSVLVALYAAIRIWYDGERRLRYFFIAGGRWRQGLALVLLALSVLSASYPTWNPWTHPWLVNLMVYLEWIEL